MEQIVQQATQWARGHRLISAAALVGSQARGTARADSDIDLMFLTEQPLFFRTSTDWLYEIGWGDGKALSRENYRIESWEDKEYGAVWSRHIRLDVGTDCTEVELSFGQLDWASIAPLDSGTQRIVRDGCCILYNPEGRLTRLVRFVSKQS